MIAIAHPRNRRHPLWCEVEQQLTQRGELQTLYSEWSGHSAELARTHCPQSGVVLVVGGDGTFNEVVNGWMQQENRGRPSFLLVPLGTGNDFARDQSLSRDAHTIISSALQPAIKEIDLGWLSYQGQGEIGERYFLNAATIGFSAEVTRFFQTLPRVLPGTAQYLFSLLVSLVRWRNRSTTLSLDGEETLAKNLFNLNLANSKYYGGGMYASPRACVESGRLETVLMELNKLGVVRALPRNYNGKFDGVEGVRQWSLEGSISVDEASIPVQADGEYLGTTPVEAKILPKELSLVLTGSQK